jgi:aspartyl-tRNA(Asn)/glutamyl-tRNA(Gln) amidotransferase subunit B
MELVTEPDIKNTEEAVAFAKELQLILRYLGASDADMEKGQMRLEANVSIRPHDTEKLGTKVEVKNINSFKALGAAIEYELKRQEEMLGNGEMVKQETRGWDDVKMKTVSQRSKEEAHDYRYFPEPDLPPFETSVFGIDELRATLPELPKQKQERFLKEFGLSEKQVQTLISSPELANFFEAAVSEAIVAEEPHPEHPAVGTIYNYLTSDLMGLINEAGSSFSDLKITPEHLAHLIALIHGGKIQSRQAKDILRKMFETGLDPEDILNNEGLHTVSDEEELKKVIEEVLRENPQAASDFKKGKEASMQFLIGKAMGKLRGRGNPDLLKQLFFDALR